MYDQDMRNGIFLLIRRIKEGDKTAFSQLYRSYYPRIYSFLYTLLKDSPLAEEITQDVFVRLWINREKLDETASPDPYFFSIAKNTVLNLYKKKQVEERYLESLQVHTEERTEQELYYKELLHLIDDTVDKMPTQQQRIFRLSRDEGLLNAEIAEKLQLSKRTVEKHISNALSQLRDVINNNYLFFFFL